MGWVWSMTDMVDDAPKRGVKMSPSQLERLSAITQELVLRLGTQADVGAQIGRDQGNVSRALNRSPGTSVEVARRLCAIYDPERTVEDLLGPWPAPPRLTTPQPFAAVSAKIRAGAVVGEEALQAAAIVAQGEPWWQDDAIGLAKTFAMRNPERAAAMTAKRWLIKLEEWSRFVDTVTSDDSG